MAVVRRTPYGTPFQQAGVSDFATLQIATPDEVNEMQRMAVEEGAVIHWLIYHAPSKSVTQDGRHPPFVARPILYNTRDRHESLVLPIVLLGDSVAELRAVVGKYAVNLNVTKIVDPALIEVWGPDPKTFVAGPRG